MLEFNGKEVDLGRFPDGTLHLKPDEWQMLESSQEVRPAITWRYENDAELFALCSIARHVQKYCPVVDLFMPYIPNARMDRVKNSGDVLTLKHFAEIINLLGFGEVSVLDPHSTVSEALIERIVCISPRFYINLALNEINKSYEDSDVGLLMFYPDEGAMKRYSEMIDLPYAFGVKKRDWKTRKILRLKVVNKENLVPGQSVLIVDDICSTGDTLYYSAKALKELGVGDIFLYVTHCENTVLKGRLLDSGLIEKIFTTDSICTAEHEKIVKFAL